MTFKEILELILTGSDEEEDRYINLKELHDWLQKNFFWVDMAVDEFYGKVVSELTIYTEEGDD